MHLGRIFASAIVRRLAYALVALALAWCGIGRAEAAICGLPTFAEAIAPASPSARNSREEAYAACMSVASPATNFEGGGGWFVEGTRGQCVKGTGNSYSFQWQITRSRNSPGCGAGSAVTGTRPGASWTWTVECPNGGTWNEETKTCGTCSDKPPLGPSSWSGVNSSFQMCKESCVYEGGAGPSGVGVCLGDGFTVDGVVYHTCSNWGPTGAACTAGSGGFPSGSPSESPSDSDGDGTSDGNDGSPNNPGSGGQGPNGDGPAEGDSDCGGAGQPVCGATGSGSGNGNTSGGGGDCKTPPNSKGDPILAQIAFQTWATRCALTGNANAGSGTGNGQGEGTGGTFDGDAEGVDASKHGENGDPERGDVVEEPGTDEGELDASGYGYTRTCVASPSVSVFGQTITFDTGPMCEWLLLGSWFVLVLAAMASARIINGGMA